MKFIIMCGKKEEEGEGNEKLGKRKYFRQGVLVEVPFTK